MSKEIINKSKLVLVDSQLREKDQVINWWKKIPETGVNGLKSISFNNRSLDNSYSFKLSYEPSGWTTPEAFLENEDFFANKEFVALDTNH